MSPYASVDELDRAVRMHVFTTIVETSAAPAPAEIAAALGAVQEDVEGALRRLAARRALVLSPTSTAVWMANPFSAVPTTFRVYAGDRRYYGNCIWDALGIPAALAADARIEARCGDCSEALGLEVREGMLVRSEGIIHFAVPAARWWENIGFT